MSSQLFDYEWQFLLQMITRVNYADTYQETCGVLLQQLKTLISFSSAIIFQASREDGEVTLTNPISTEAVNDESDHDFFMSGKYPHWNEFLMAPYSSVFRQSDLIPQEKWEKTRVYREVWQPRNHYWGIFIAIVHKDCPLAVLGLLRSRGEPDFGERDKYVIDTIKDPLARKFFSLRENRMRRVGTVQYDERIVKAAAQYNLTKRETEIVALSCAGKSSEDMCALLYITNATLSKHLSNIYAKTKARNRTQLYGLFRRNT
jgi:DNA-binding CsgD family transcriptional regulator